MRTRSIVLVVGWMGCSGAAPNPAAPAAVPTPIDAGPVVAAVDALAVDAPNASPDASVSVTRDPDLDRAPPVTVPPPPVEIAAALQVRPRVRGQKIVIDEGKRKALGGVQIGFGSSGHKHRADRGPAVGIYTFTLRRGSSTDEVELRSDQPRFQAEVVAHRALFVFEHQSYTRFTVVLAAARAPTPLDEDACAARIDAAAGKAGLVAGTSRSLTTELGILEVHDLGWRGYCGLYTRRVWFAPLTR